MNIPANVRVRKLERVGSLDRYGVPTREPIETNFGAHLVHADRLIRGPNGDQKQIDATMRVHGNIDVIGDDFITLDTPKTEQYTVFQVREVSDSTGVVVARDLILTKAVQTGSA